MSCNVHVSYRGLRLGKKNKECPECVEFFNSNQKNNIREKRNIKKTLPAVETKHDEKLQEQVDKLLEETNTKVETKVGNFELDDSELENLI